MSRRHRMAWVAVVAVLAGCGPGETGAPEAGPDLEAQARAALARYDRAVLDAGGGQRFVPVGGLTGQLGDWEAGNEDHKLRLAAGRVVATTTLPAAPQPAGVVVWASGTSQTLPLVPADEALGQVTAEGTGECGECAPLEVTGARLSTTPIETTRGPATAPAWEFTLRGTSVRMTRVAVAGSATVRVSPPAWDPYDAPGGTAVEAATTTLSGRRLTVTFTGTPGPATEPCGADYTARTVESAHAVVAIVVERRHAANENCTAIGARRTATVDLDRPLGERAVLEVQQGLPVPLTITG